MASDLKLFAARALSHSRPSANAPVTLVFHCEVPVDLAETYLSDPRVSGIVIADESNSSANQLRDHARIGRYWRTGWSLPVGSERVYFSGSWRAITVPMLLSAVRGNVRELRVQCGIFWIPVPVRALRALKNKLLGETGKTPHRPLLKLISILSRLRRASAATSAVFGRASQDVVASEISIPDPRDYDRAFSQLVGSATLEHKYEPVLRRVVLVCGSLQPGGAERQVAYTASGLSKQALEGVHLLSDYLTPNHDRKYDFYLPLVTASGTSVRQIRIRTSPGERGFVPAPLTEVARLLPSGLVADIANLYWEFLELRPEVVHAWLDWSNIRAGLAAVLAGVPKIILSGRNLNPSHFALHADYMRPAYKALLECPRVTFLNNSRAGADDYATWLGIAPHRIAVIRNGVDFNHQSRLGAHDVRSLRDSFGIPASAFLIGGMFRFAEEKRPLLWIETASLIAARIPQAHFILFGHGDLHDEMVRDIARRGLTQRVTLAGISDDAFSAISMMDVLMLTSYGEGIPNVLLEAQWVGTPVVATRAGGVPETVLPGVTGWIEDSADSKALSDLVYELWANEGARLRARQQGPIFVRERFNVGRMIAETMKAYQLAPPERAQSDSAQ